MTVHVVELQSGGMKPFELRSHLHFKLRAQITVEKVPYTGVHRIVRELASFVHQSGNFFARQGRAATEQRKMQADAESWIFLRQRDRFLESRLIHHQTCSSQDTLAMRADDSLIDRM